MSLPRAERQTSEDAKISQVQVDELPQSVSTTTDEEKGGHTQPRKSRFSVNTEEWWLWEAFGIVGSLVALVGLIALVAALDNKPLPKWSQAQTFCAPTRLTEHLPGRKSYCGTVTVSVNSIIAWLSTGAKMCVLIPISSCLGQLKWIWFSEQERSLSDLNKFDSAARVLIGSLTLAWTLRGRSVFGGLIKRTKHAD